MRSRVFGFVDHSHTAVTQLVHDKVVRDCLPDHAQGCYGGSIPKSMKVGELAVFQKDCWRNIAIALTTLGQPCGIL
jgi:hypothetical protein